MNRAMAWLLALLLAALGAAGCAGRANASFAFDFERDAAGFEAVFSDYHDDGNDNASYQMASAQRDIPVSGAAGKGLYIAAMNRSDDLFMGFVKELSGLKKSAAYTFEISFRLATAVDGGGIGIGGSPGSSVAVKAGIVPEKPEIAKDATGVFRFTNVDSGRQMNDGSDLKIVANMEKPAGSAEGFVFKDCSLSAAVSSNSEGRVYLVIGSDSGFEGFTEYYLDDVVIKAEIAA